jgi:hypothetical protein
MGSRFVVKMDDASGLAAGAPVYVSGVRVGTVQSAKLEGDKARVEFDVEGGSGVIMRRDACASPGWYAGSISPHLKLEVGTAAAPPLPTGGELSCVKSGGAMTAEAEKTLAALRKVLESVVEGKGTISRLLKDEELAQRIAEYYAKPPPSTEEKPGSDAPAKAPTSAPKVQASPPAANPIDSRR